MIRVLVAAAVAAGVGGCLAGCSKTSVSGTEVALTALDQAAVEYVTLPLCPQPSGTLCSVAATSTQIKVASAQAYAAVKAAEAGTGTVAAAQAALDALAALVSPAPTTNN
jgi:hypothetical protein